MKRALLRDYGEATLQAAIDRCSPEARAILGGALLSTAFYPEAVIGEFLAEAVRVVGAEKLPAYARKVAQEQVNTIFKFLLRFFISPRKLSENNHKLWEAMHDTGKLTATHGADDRSHMIEITGFTFPNPEYERVFIEYHCGVLELTGVKNVRCVSQQTGPDRYRQKYAWEP
jgi:hypothetical protein